MKKALITGFGYGWLTFADLLISKKTGKFLELVDGEAH